MALIQVAQQSRDVVELLSRSRDLTTSVRLESVLNEPALKRLGIFDGGFSRAVCVSKDKSVIERGMHCRDRAELCSGVGTEAQAAAVEGPTLLKKQHQSGKKQEASTSIVIAMSSWRS
jgi:hypothetical protein